MSSSPVVLLLVASALLRWPMPSALRRPKTLSPLRRSLAPARRRALVVTSGALAVAVLLRWPWWFGLTVAGAAAVATLRMPERRSSGDRSKDHHRLAVHADLVAACLDAGMSIGAALTAVAPASSTSSASTWTATAAAKVRDSPSATLSDPIVLLDGVAALLMLGLDPASAWASVQHHPDLALLAAAAGRSSAGGAKLADAVREHAAHLRVAVTDAGERAAGRAGVAMTAPLGLCFLPAFLCLGLAPVVVGLLSTLHLF